MTYYGFSISNFRGSEESAKFVNSAGETLSSQLLFFPLLPIHSKYFFKKRPTETDNKD